MIESLHANDARTVSFSANDVLAVARDSGIDGLVGESAPMQALFEQMRRVAPTQASVLIVGEVGVGKQGVAKALHELGPRHDQPFVAVDCGAIPSTTIEAELVGHSEAMESAAATRGNIERAGSGTLLLEDISSLSADMQVKLLHALESGRFRPVGSETETPLRCRVFASIHEDPNRAVETGALRADLLYRIAVFPLLVPPLRARDDDAALLAQYFLNQLNAQENASKHFSRDSIACLRQYSWPGNVRELRNAVHRAFILASDELDLRAVTGKPIVLSANHDEQLIHIPVGTSIAEAERWMIIATLKKCGGNKTRAAALLGVSLKTLYNRLNAYRAQGLEISDIDSELAEVEV